MTTIQIEPPGDGDHHRNYLLSLDAALAGSQEAIERVAGLLAELAAGERPSQVTISEYRTQCRRYLEGLAVARGVIAAQLAQQRKG